MDILEFRESFINEDINAEAINTSRYPIEVFIDRYEPMFLCVYKRNKGL